MPHFDHLSLPGEIDPYMYTGVVDGNFNSLSWQNLSKDSGQFLWQLLLKGLVPQDCSSRALDLKPKESFHNFAKAPFTNSHHHCQVQSCPPPPPQSSPSSCSLPPPRSPSSLSLSPSQITSRTVPLG